MRMEPQTRGIYKKSPRFQGLQFPDHQNEVKNYGSPLCQVLFQYFTYIVSYFSSIPLRTQSWDVEVVQIETVRVNIPSLDWFLHPYSVHYFPWRCYGEAFSLLQYWITLLEITCLYVIRTHMFRHHEALTWLKLYRHALQRKLSHSH